MPKKSLKGELALVTGGGGGLGRLLALRLVRAGASVVLWDINPEGKCFFVVVVVTFRGQWKAWEELYLEVIGRKL